MRYAGGLGIGSVSGQDRAGQFANGSVPSATYLYTVGPRTDALGRRLGFAVFSVCSIPTVLVYTLLPVGDSMMLVLGFPRRIAVPLPEWSRSSGQCCGLCSLPRLVITCGIAFSDRSLNLGERLQGDFAAPVDELLAA